MVALLTDNDVQVALGALALLTLLVKQWRNDRVTKDAAGAAHVAADAAQEAAGQLRNNSGSTALDKLQDGIAEVHKRLDGHDDRFARLESLVGPQPDDSGQAASSP